jgi:hypothetical protein
VRDPSEPPSSPAPSRAVPPQKPPRPFGRGRRLSENAPAESVPDAWAHHGATQDRVINERAAMAEWFSNCVSIPMGFSSEDKISIHDAAESYAYYCRDRQYPTYDIHGFVGELANLAKEYKFTMGGNCDILGARLNP